MNIVIVSDCGYVNGGAARVAILSARALAAKGFKVHFLCGAGPVCESLQEQPNLGVVCLNQKPYNEERGLGTVMRGLWDRNARLAIAGLLEALDPSETVVHIHSNRDALSASVLAPPLGRFRVVYTCHEYGLACPYACFYDHGRQAICERRALSASCLVAHCNRKGYDKKLFTYAKGVVQNGLLRLPHRVDDIIFVSEFSRRVLAPYVGPRARQHILANPVDAARGEKRKLTRESPFLFVGLLTPGKDPVLAAESARQAGVPIRFVGDGELRDEVLGANPDAAVTGWLDTARVRAEMLRARAVVLPTRWYETQGLVVAEAASLGVPAIVSSVCSASEMIDDGVNGIIVQPGSHGELASALEMLEDDGTACEMGEAAYAKFWSCPSDLAHHIQGLLEVYGLAAHLVH